MATVKLKNVYLHYPASQQAGIKSLVAQKLLRRSAGTRPAAMQSLSNINFDLKDGDRLALLGGNGSGKTTLLNTISGLFEPNKGLIEVEGSRSSFIQISAGMDHGLSGEDNVRVHGLYRGLPADQLEPLVSRVYEFSELGEKFFQPIKTYSSGMLVRLAFAMSTDADPEILILDEWLSAGDKNFLEKATVRMEDLALKARIIILATHDIELARRWCTVGMVMNQGVGEFFNDIESAILHYQEN